MRITSIVCLFSLLAFATACGSAYAPAQEGEATPGSARVVFEAEKVSYLETTVAPCAPLSWSEADPCALRDWENRYWIDYIAQDQEFFTEVEVESEYFLPYPPPTALEVIRAEFEQEKGATGYGYSGRLSHIIARGVFVPGTARCAMHDHRVDAHPDPNLFNAPPQHFRY